MTFCGLVGTISNTSTTKWDQGILSDWHWLAGGITGPVEGRSLVKIIEPY